MMKKIMMMYSMQHFITIFPFSVIECDSNDLEATIVVLRFICIRAHIHTHALILFLDLSLSYMYY